MVTDGYAGQNDQAHEATLNLLELLSPMVRLATSPEMIAQREETAA
ncbi:hypothetical protein [Arthrobacter sp. VKM Ac-2550]|nr:hypothetical protein [Arthrobacter sp. VKM Ac-2550]